MDFPLPLAASSPPPQVEKSRICNTAAKWWSEEVKEATSIRILHKERHTQGVHTSKTTAGWEEYATARNKIKGIVDREKGIWEDVVNETNGDFDDGMKQMWVGIKGMLGKQTGEADTGIATLRARKMK